MVEPHELSIVDAARRIADGSLLPSALVEDCLQQIHRRDPEVHAWELLDADGARAQAAALDHVRPHSPLHGIPVAVKDIIDVRGLPTRCGSALRGDAPATHDAWVVEQLRNAGAVVIGKSVTTEFACFEPGPTRNPWDLRRTPGGSSSGSAAAVADRMVPLGLGSQTAASTTRPASYCGLAGLVTTPGQYDDTGVAGLSRTLDSLGFLTRTIADLELVATTLLGIDVSSTLQRAPTLLRCDGAMFGEVEETMTVALSAAAKSLSTAGAHLTPPRATAVQQLQQAHKTVMAVEASRSLAAEASDGRLSSSLQSLLDNGRHIPEADYRDAVKLADEERTRILELFDESTAILAPAASGVAPIGMATGSPDLSRPWQLLGLPSVTIPGAHSAQGLPLGIQVVGAPGKESDLLAIAHWVDARI